MQALVGEVHSKYFYMNNLDKIEQRVRNLEFQLSRLKDNLRNMDNTLGEGGHIDTAFQLLTNEIDDAKSELNSRIDEVNQKLDIIIQHLTGMNEPE